MTHPPLLCVVGCWKSSGGCRLVVSIKPILGVANETCKSFHFVKGGRGKLYKRWLLSVDGYIVGGFLSPSHRPARVPL